MPLATWQVSIHSILCQFWAKTVIKCPKWPDDQLRGCVFIWATEPGAEKVHNHLLRNQRFASVATFSIVILATWTASAPARTTTATTAATTASRTTRSRTTTTTTSKTKTGEAGNERKLKRPKISSQVDAWSSPESIKRFRRQLTTFSRSQMSEKWTVLNLEEP